MAKKPTPHKAAPKKAKKHAPPDAPAVTPAVAAEAEKTGTNPAMQAVVEQGREARRNAIAREDAPHAGGTARDAWEDGWDQQHKALGG